MSVQKLHSRIADEEPDLQVLDVRRDDEWEEGRVPTARPIFAPYLLDHLGELDRDKPTVTYCGSGYRASIAASLLKRSGFREVYNVPGSMAAWKAAGYTNVKL